MYTVMQTLATGPTLTVRCIYARFSLKRLSVLCIIFCKLSAV